MFWVLCSGALSRVIEVVSAFQLTQVLGNINLNIIPEILIFNYFYVLFDTKDKKYFLVNFIKHIKISTLL